MEQLTAEQERQRPAQEETLLATIGYLPMMFFIPLLLGKPEGFARFHGRQSLFLFATFAVLWIAIWIVEVLFGRIMGDLVILGFVFRAIAWVVYNIVGVVVSLFYIALMVAAIVQAAMGREWHIPLLDAYVHRIRFWN